MCNIITSESKTHCSRKTFFVSMFSTETSSAQKTGEFQNSGEPRTEAVSEDRLIIASLKQELDAQDENDEGSANCGEMGGPAERGVMQIKMETDFTECSPTERLVRERSAGQTGPVVSGCVGDETLLPTSESHEPEVFPCVERTWSVCDPVAKEAEPQVSQVVWVRIYTLLYKNDTAQLCHL